MIFVIIEIYRKYGVNYMLKTAFEQLPHIEFNLKNIETYSLSYSDSSSSRINYLSHGRTKCMLHLCLSGTRYYRTESQELYVKADNMIFIPDGTKYLTHAVNAELEECNGANICFDVYGEDNEKIDFEQRLYIQIDGIAQSVKNDFLEIVELWTKSPHSVLQIKSLLYSILYKILNSRNDESNDFYVIKPAIDFLTHHYKENIHVGYYAKLCNLSESNFRKKFTDIMRKSPVDYRNELRFNEAKRLSQMNVSLQEIAEDIGFYDSSHLTKLYKKYRGVSLKKDVEFI